MKYLELEKFGVQEMNTIKMKETNGGCIGILAAIAIGLAIAAGTEIFSDWDNFKAGLTGKPEQK
ncbi:MAG: hypothetical protein HQ543_01055 [Bacteroidetes bacterium]|nr:hypothetical protein [Bacteroidota bacterium]